MAEVKRHFRNQVPVSHTGLSQGLIIRFSEAVTEFLSQAEVTRKVEDK